MAGSTKSTAKKAAPKKRTAAKKVPKKAAKSTVKKSAPLRKATTKKPVSKKSAPKPSNPRASETVSMPETASLRMKEKVIAIAEAIIEDFHPSAAKIAVAGGLCFVLLGATVAASHTYLAKTLSVSMVANVGSSTGSGGSTVTGTNNTVPNPELLAIEPSLPGEFLEPEQFLVTTLLIDSVKFEFKSLETANTKVFSASKSGTDLFQVTINPDDLVPGQHNVTLALRTLDGTIIREPIGTTTVRPAVSPEVKVIKNLPNALIIPESYEQQTSVMNADVLDFTLKNQQTNSVIELQPESTGSDLYTVVIETADLTVGKYELGVRYVALDATATTLFERLKVFEVVDQTTAASTSQSSSGSTGTQSGSGSTNATTNTTASSSPTTVTNTASTSPDVDTEVVLRVSRNIAKAETLYVEAPKETTAVRLYYRKTISTQRMLLGKAVKANLQWLYYLDPTLIPNGEYYVIAVAETPHGKFEDRERVRIELPVYEQLNESPDSTSEPLPPPQTTNSTDQPKEPISGDPQSIQEPESNDDERPLFTDNEDVAEAQDSSDSELDAIIEAYRKEIDQLLRNYAIAIQGGDPMLIERARLDLRNKQSELVSAALIDPELRLLADRIEAELSKRIARLQEQVETFEELRKRDSNEESSIDTDGDGISDFDERVLFRTDPFVADSDNDGVLDGVEILGGFDPLDYRPEAVVVYESPKESLAYVDEEVLLIEDVNPVVQRPADNEGSYVGAEIRGKALPNSFVTLYIYSTPTIVTVKTDADGSFVYRFEDELEDGEHEVYVAVTDNTGAIVAQSNPFRFVKEAEAFTQQELDEEPPVLSTIQENDTSNLFVAVAGMGVLGLGLVLLMIGLGLREQTPVVTVTSESTT